MMDINTLGIECDANGDTKVTAWAKCRSGDDIDDVILWLGLARDVMLQWHDIRTRRLAAAAGNVTSIKKKGDT
jgi:hypothetical protein